jgi:arsenite methyltransferase
VPVAQAKACCAAAYSSDIVALVLGTSYHPGGLTLTRHLAHLVGLQPGHRVLDVASGPGATAVLLAEEHDVVVDGVDLGEASVDRAAQAAQAAGLTHRVRFRVGDAERLPFDDATFDAIICECAFCTFPDKPGAAAEFARVLKPGGRLGLTDVTVAAAGLPAELAGVVGWVACLADARPVESYAELLADAGLGTRTIERHDSALADMVDHIQARLTALRIVGRANPALAGVDFDRALELTALARRAVEDGSAGYALLVAAAPPE